MTFETPNLIQASNSNEAKPSYFQEVSFLEKETPQILKALLKVTPENLSNFKEIWGENLKNAEGFLTAIATLPVIHYAELKLQEIKESLGNNHRSESDKKILRDKKIEALKELSLSLGEISKYLIDNNKKVSQLKIFWQLFQNYSEQLGEHQIFKEIRSGILGQTAAYHLIKSRGLNCILSNWEEDVFEGSDFSISNNEINPSVGKLQVKHRGSVHHLEIRNTKTYNPLLSVETQLPSSKYGYKTYFTPDTSFENLAQNCSADEYGFYLILPGINPDGSPAIDPIRGIPSEYLTEEFKTKSVQSLDPIFSSK